MKTTRNLSAKKPFSVMSAVTGLSLTLLFLFLLCAGIVQAQTLIDPAVNSFSSELTPYGRQAVHTVDGSGLTAGASAILGAADSTVNNGNSGVEWTTDGTINGPSDLNPSITYDLLGVYNLQTIRVWNYNEGGLPQVGPSSILLSTSVDGTNFTQFGIINPAQAGGTNGQPGQDFAMSVANVRYVQLQILSNWDGAIFWDTITGADSSGNDGRSLTGLQEVRFVGAQVTTPTPVFSPAAGNYANRQAVTISDVDTNATIYYSTNAWATTNVYSTPISFQNGGFNIQAFASHSGFPDSSIGSVSYTVFVPTPVLSSPGGNYVTPIAVSVSCTDTFATIYYSTNAWATTNVYGTPINIPANASGFTILTYASDPPLNSSVVSGSYSRSSGSIIQPTVNAVSSELAQYGRQASHTVAGSGLANGPSGVSGEADSTVNNDSGAMWTTLGTAYGTNDLDPSITYDLGGVYNLQTVRIWNYNEGGFNFVGASNILLSTSADGVNFTSNSIISLAEGSGNNGQSGQDFALSVANVRYTRLEILTDWDGVIFQNAITPTGNFAGVRDNRALTGLSEVRFVGIHLTTPHPDFNPPSENFVPPLAVQISCPDASAIIYFSTDAWATTNVYNGTPVSVPTNASGFVIQAYAKDPSLSTSVTVSASYTATPIITPSVVQFSSELTQYGRQVVHTVDGSGLTAGASAILGAADSTVDNNSANMWTTDGKGYSPNDMNPSVTYDLGGIYNLQTARVWQYNESGFSKVGASNIVVSTSVDGTNFTQFGTFNLTRGGEATNEPAQDFAVSVANVRYVQLQILSTFDGTIYWSSITGTNQDGGDGRDLTGLSEVRFEGTRVISQPVISRGASLGGGQFKLTFSGPGNQNYSVLTSTNVALPLSNWTVLTSSTFVGSPVNYTDTTATNKSQFYIIRSP